jgi:hypothetical protein
MRSANSVSEPQPGTVIPAVRRIGNRAFLQKLRGGTFLTLGFLLSPLSWWNDLIFNLPLAYGVGYLCSLVVSDWLLPGTIAGYWLSNILGILLLQSGVLDLLAAQPPTDPPQISAGGIQPDFNHTFKNHSFKKHSFKKELFTGVVSATLYTGLIVALVQLKILETPLLLLNQQFPQISAFLPR